MLIISPGSETAEITSRLVVNSGQERLCLSPRAIPTQLEQVIPHPQSFAEGGQDLQSLAAFEEGRLSNSSVRQGSRVNDHSKQGNKIEADDEQSRLVGPVRVDSEPPQAKKPTIPPANFQRGPRIPTFLEIGQVIRARKGQLEVTADPADPKGDFVVWDKETCNTVPILEYAENFEGTPWKNDATKMPKGCMILTIKCESIVRCCLVDLDKPRPYHTKECTKFELIGKVYGRTETENLIHTMKLNILREEQIHDQELDGKEPNED
ncbi:MAG: hypothetical protein Q9227_004744 [Pyrenula ochraceoflavens]